MQTSSPRRAIRREYETDKSLEKGGAARAAPPEFKAHATPHVEYTGRQGILSVRRSGFDQERGSAKWSTTHPCPRLDMVAQACASGLA
jgi:hypothetical protein